MRFWQIENLKDELARDDLSPVHALQYMIAIGLVTTLAYGLPFLTNNFWDFLTALGDSMILVVGSIVAYRANGGKEGRDFLGRYFALSWVVGIRVLVLFLVPMLALLFSLETYLYGDVPEVTTPFEVPWMLAMSAVFYWRVAVNMAGIYRKGAV